MMNRPLIFQVIGILGAIASIAALIGSYFADTNFVQWLSTPLELPSWAIALTVAILSILLAIAGRMLIVRVRFDAISADAAAVFNFVKKENLLSTTRHLDLNLYTAETITGTWRHVLEDQNNALVRIRILVRRPEIDPGKHRVAEGSLDTVREICDINPKCNLDLRFYDDEPLLRLQYFKSNGNITLLAGVYRYDDIHPMRYVGAEDNSLLVLTGKRPWESNVIRAFHSRFEHQWNNCSPLRAVIFDLDGVLLNSMPIHYRSWLEAFQEVLPSLDVEEFRLEIYRMEGAISSALAKHLFIKFTGKVATTDELQNIVQTKHELFMKYSDRAKPFDGTVDLLNYLHERSVPIAVVTGSTGVEARNILKQHFATPFQAVICGDDVAYGKPDAAPYDAAIQQLRIGNRDQCLVIENAPLGVKSSVSAGIPTVGVLMGSPIGPQELEAEGAIRVFSNQMEIRRFVEGLRFGELAKPPNKSIQRTGEVAGR